MTLAELESLAGELSASAMKLSRKISEQECRNSDERGNIRSQATARKIAAMQKQLDQTDIRLDVILSEISATKYGT